MSRMRVLPPLGLGRLGGRGGAKWRRHVHCATRKTTFGTETIVVNGRKTEEFLTVMERQGEKTWR